MEKQPVFVEEINLEELNFYPEILGRGAFGVVRRARWRNIDVAVKGIETEAEKKAFITELKQLSRVNHPNIVKLYGACTQPPMVCLVMEFAEGGSLYNVLHGENLYIEYSAAHAISWCLQCARGVGYLHGMKPKPLIHRDLKPPNLLLVQGGTVLKICDFGTACDAHTYMTNNKGSAAWMAPEVFEGSNYSEKCDVFSFGIILWEVVTRRKPFDEIGGPAFRIMWAVHNGTRPPLVKTIPKPLELLMTRCWSANPVERPDIFEVIRVMSSLSKFFPGADVPLVLPAGAEQSSVYDTPPPTNMSSQHVTVKQKGEIVPLTPSTPKPRPVVVQEETRTRTSAPPSLAASRENLLQQDKSSRSSTPSIDPAMKRRSADLSKLDEDVTKFAGQPVAQNKVFGHRRAGSHGNPFVFFGNQGNVVQHHAPVISVSRARSYSTPYVWGGGAAAESNSPASHSPQPQPQPGRGHRRNNSYGNTPFNPADLVAAPAPVDSSVPHHATMQHIVTAPASLAQVGGGDGTEAEAMGAPARSMSWTPGFPLGVLQPVSDESRALMTDPAEDMAFQAMDQHLQPITPCLTSSESMRIFKEHMQLARDYQRMQAEIFHLTKRQKELQRLLEEEDTEESNEREEYQQLMNEMESLTPLHINLKKQLRVLRGQRGQGGETMR